MNDYMELELKTTIKTSRINGISNFHNFTGRKCRYEDITCKT